MRKAYIAPQVAGRASLTKAEGKRAVNARRVRYGCRLMPNAPT